jgi:LytS/YehU family sensor histidine kinase
LSRADAAGAELRHRLVEARLAAMQAQVEPQFLFETLVEIESAYEHDAARAARALDRLIAFLRLALPGLRASGYMAGSTLTAELALVQAYLGVIDARGDIAAEWQIEIDAACAPAGISPMLLLPLVQAMVRCLVGNRLQVLVRAQCRDERTLVIEMRALGSTVHNDQPEFLHVRERLDALYDGRAALTSELHEPAQTVLRLTLPQLA